MARAVTTSKSQLSAKQQTARREASADWGLWTVDWGAAEGYLRRAQLLALCSAVL